MKQKYSNILTEYFAHHKINVKNIYKYTFQNASI